MLKIRQILEQLYKASTENAKQSFNGLFARMQFANETAKLNAELQKQSNQLRILCNKIAHEEVKEVGLRDFNFALLVLQALLQSFCPQYRDEQLAIYLADKQLPVFEPFRDAQKQSFSCIVNSWLLQGETLEIEAVREDGSFCNIKLNNDSKQAGHDGRLWTKLGKVLWRYASLQCHELSEISGKPDCLMSNPHTLIVVEPDFLLDASALAACFDSFCGDPIAFMLNHLFRDSSSEAQLQGSLVNSIFDDLVFEPQANYLKLFKHGLASLPIAMVALGKEAAVNIYNRIKDEHLPQLNSFITGLGEAEILLEPSFICPDYGLQGRLDLLSQENGSYSIVELKSGKAHPHAVWPAQQMQVIAYNMLIRSAYGARRVSNASILYSASPDNPLRHVANLTILEQDLLMCRNRVIGIMHTLAEQPEPLFNWLKTYSQLPSNPILRRSYERYQALAASLTDYETEWFIAMVQRVVREIWFVKTGDNGSLNESSYGHSALWQLGKSEKQAAYKIITGLSPLAHSHKTISFTIPLSDDIADFREGDIVVLYDESIPITRQEIMRGVIKTLGQDALEIMIRGGLKNNKRFAENSRWAIEHDTLEAALYAPLGSLVAFLMSSSQQRKIILGLQAPGFAEPVIPADGLDEIISRMHIAKELFIVQGPPGTGKTSGLLGRYVEEIYTKSDKNILIISFTNRAVDEICQCLIRKAVPFLRSGSSATIAEQLLSVQIEGKRFEEIAEIVKNNRIWVATVQSASAWYRDILKIIQFHEVIIDEASQIVESSILGLVSQIPKIILIGDQNQLPPIVVQSPLPFAFTHPVLSRLQYGSFNQSLMERLHRVHSTGLQTGVLAMLRLHYRMHSSIAKLIEPSYQNQLICATEQQKATLNTNPDLPQFFSQRLVWISCPPSGVLHYDPLQVKLITAMIGSLAKAGELNEPQQNIGVVAPFRAMIHALRKELALSPALQNITIDTVERFQGSERDTIILCLPLKHASNLSQIQSLTDDGLIDRKLNVALSRAKQRIIILGTLNLCKTSMHYAKLIENISQNGIIIDSTVAANQLLLRL